MTCEAAAEKDNAGSASANDGMAIDVGGAATSKAACSTAAAEETPAPSGDSGCMQVDVPGGGGVPACASADTGGNPPPVADVVEGQTSAKEFITGMAVEICGTAMNGSVGTLEDFLEEKQRWRVRFSSGLSKNFKADNLRAAPAPIDLSVQTPALAATDTRKTRQKKRNRDAQATKTPPGAEVNDERHHANAEKSPRTLSAMADQGLSGVLAMLQRGEGAAPGTPPSNSHVAQACSEEERQVHEGEDEESEPTVRLAGATFASRDELVAHVRAVQERLESSSKDGMLHDRDRFLFFHLLLQHSAVLEMLSSPMIGIRYGMHPKHQQNKCFMVVCADGSQHPVSLMKCVKEAFGLTSSARPSKRARRQAEAMPETGGKQEAVRSVRTRQEVGLRLLGELAAESGVQRASDWEYVLRDEGRRCFAGLLRQALGPELACRYFEKARDGTRWDQPEDPRSGEPIPRKTAWMTSGGCTCTYRYGGVDVAPQPFPEWMFEIMKICMPLCGLQEQTQWPNSCNLNLYEDGDMSVGWHADDEKLFQGRYTDIRIISLSLGQARTFELRTNAPEAETGERAKCRMLLEDGDLCTMEGLTQQQYQHRVPKENEAEETRINFTWRWVAKHYAGCAANKSEGPISTPEAPSDAGPPQSA